jgi:hypothetical protein
MRKVRFYSTAGQTNVQHEFQGTTFGELKELMKTNNISYSGMKCVVGETKLTVEHDQAILPDGDFTLFIMPVKTKSGSLSRPEAYAAVKAHIERDGDKARNHFNSNKNYTNKSTDMINALLDSYSPGANLTPTPVKKETKEKAQKISEVFEVFGGVGDSKSSDTQDMCDQLNIVKRAKDLVRAVDLVLDGDEKKKTLREPLEALRGALGMGVSEELVEIRKQKAEEEVLKEQAKDLAKGFGDVRM